MRDVNLIPAPRRDARQRRRHIQWCATGCILYALGAATAGALARAAWGGRDPRISSQLAAVDQNVRQSEQALTEARARLNQAQTVLVAVRQISQRPDWSALLALLARKSENQIVLRTCELSPPAGQSEGAFVAVAAGIARTPADAQEYAIRLQKTGLFERVTLLDTHREPFAGIEASAFRIECALGTVPATASAGKDEQP